MNKFSCCFENNQKGLYHPKIIKRLMTFTKKFLTNSCDPNELEEKDLEKILKKKIIHIWNEIIAVLIAEKEKFSMLLILKAIFEDSISNYFLYKILSFIYKFEKRGT